MSSTKMFPEIDIAKCITCGKCLIVCPNNAIEKTSNQSCSKCIKYCFTFEVPCNPDRYVICREKCNSCGQCISICEVGAINFVEVKRA